MVINLTVSRSPERLGFVLFLRTGARLPQNTRGAWAAPLGKKFNPYHDSQNGQFTFGPTGGSASDGVYRPSEGKPSLIRTGAEEPFRGIGDNGGPPLDPITLDQAFPGLSNAPAGAIIAAADPVLNLTGPRSQMTSAMSLAYSNKLIQQIQAIDPTYRYDSLGFPNTFDGQIREINDLRWDRAEAIYRKTGDTGPLQIETLRFLQDRVDAEYDNALAAAKAGTLPSAPTERMAIGNYVDYAVKEDLRDLLDARQISISQGQPIRVSGREYDSSASDTTYSIPDVRIGDTALDITLWRKTSGSRQIMKFFNSDFKPRAVVIVRPRQVDPTGSYLIKRPGK